MLTFGQSLFKQLDLGQKQNNLVTVNGILVSATDHLRQARPGVDFQTSGATNMKAFSLDPNLLTTLDYIHIELKVSNQQDITPLPNLETMAPRYSVRQGKPTALQ